MTRRWAVVVAAVIAVVVIAASFLVTGGVAADSHADRTAVGITVRGNVVDTEASQANRVASTYLEQVQDVVVYEEGGKRFAVTAGNNEGPHIVDITDVDNILPMPQPWNNAPLRPSNSGANGVDTWVANDGNRYFAVAWGASNALQIFALHSSGVLWGNWSNGSNKYIVDSGRLQLANDVFVYTLQDGTCQTSAGCEVFPGTSVNQGEPIYKQYAVVASVGNLGQGQSQGFTGSEVLIYDVTNPNALCSCSSGSGQTALLKGSVKDAGSLELFGAAGLTYYQQGDKHYALVTAESDNGVQIIDITDPENPVARDYLDDTTSLELRSATESAVYSVGGRLYAVVAGADDDGIQIIDITDPTDITAAGKLADTSSLLLDQPRGVTVHSILGLHYAIVASLHDDGIQIIDVTDPSAPVAKAQLAHGSGRLLDGAFGVDTFSDGGRHYAVVVADVSNAVQILEVQLSGNTGVLDPAFGHGGIATAAFGQSAGEVFDVVEQPDGKIVAVGYAQNVNTHGNDLVASRDFALARYHHDGSLDVSFGVGGRVLTDFTVPGSHRGGDDEARAVALQSDDKIVVAGYAAHPHYGKEFVVARYNTDGTLDTTFGTTYGGSKRGFAIRNFAATSQDDVANAVAVQTVGGNEHILVAGQSGTSFGLVRYNTVGGLDGGFGEIVNQSTRKGFQTINFSTLEDGATSLAIDASNSIVVAGFATNNNGTTTGASPTSDDHKDFAVLRISTAGDLDSGFGTSGKVTSNFDTGSVEQINDIAIDSNGKIVAVGYSGDSPAIARYNTGGALDGTFGDAKSGGQTGRQGRHIGRIGTSSAKLMAVKVRSGGKIAAAGYASLVSDPDTSILMRFSSSGDGDSTFFGNFVGDFQENTRADRVHAMALLPGGRMVLGGFINTGSVKEFALIGAQADGSLNSDFGVGGVVTTSFGSVASARAMAVQSDGKVVVAGYVKNINSTSTDTSDDHNDFAVARFNANGTLDTGFGTRGRVTTDVGTGSDDKAYAVAIDSTGKIVVAGSSSSDGTDARKNFTVVRYTSGGALDTGFDTDGKVVFDFSGGEKYATPEYSADEASALILLPDNKIIAAGYSSHEADENFAVIRFDANGALDGDESRRFQNFRVGDDRGYAAAFTPNNRFIVAGTATGDNGTENTVADDNADFGVVRFETADVVIDSTLDTHRPGTQPGTFDIVPATVDFSGTDDHARAIAIDGDGNDYKIVLAGHTTNDNGTTDNTADDYTEFALARLLTNGGVLDTSFGGGDGKVTTSFGTGGDDKITAIDIDGKGRIVVGGFAKSGASGDSSFALARYLADGTIDTSFGVGGAVTTDFGSTSDVIYGVAALPMTGGPRILAAGQSGGEFRVARYLASPPQPTDATLSGLTLNTSGDGSTFGGTAALSPAFDPSTDAYTVTLRSGVTHFTVTPTLNDEGATVTVDGTVVASGAASGAVVVTPGSTRTVEVVVVAEDGFSTSTYTITVSALSGDATLSALSLASTTDANAATFTGVGVLEPAFSPSKISYTSSLTPDVEAVKITPTAVDSNAVITVNGATVASGAASAAVSTTVGVPAVFSVVVTAEDDQVSRTYTVVVNLGNAASIAVVPNPVVEGSSAQVTVTIVEAQAGSITIPLTVSAVSAEPGDYSVPSSVRIAAGALSGSVTFRALHDTGKDDETLTVALGSPLPNDIHPGVSTVTVTIEDDEDTLPPRARAVMFPVQRGDLSLTAVWSFLGTPSLPNTAPDSFDVEYRVKGTSTWSTVTADSVADGRRNYYTHVVDGLVNGTTYELRVRARNEAGVGPYSHRLVEGTPVAPPSPPASVSAVAASTFGCSRITVSWDAVASANGYQVGYREQGQTAWQIFSFSGLQSRFVSNASRSVAGLASATTYELAVRALIDNSMSDWSTPATATTAAAPQGGCNPPRPPTRTTPTTPRRTVGGVPTGGGPIGGGRSTTTGDGGDTVTGDGSTDDGVGDGGVEQLARTAAARFTDVDVGDYYAAPVGWMVLHDITRGCDVESFCVGVSTSRKHFVTFLWRAAGQPTPRQSGSVVFDDVAVGGYVDNAVGWAFEQGITVGCEVNESERLFCPNRVVTRAQIATLLYRYTGASAGLQNIFTDVDSGSYYSSAVTWMYTHEITTGCTQNNGNLKFCPDQPATRAQVATFLYRVATTPASWGTKGGILKTDR